MRRIALTGVPVPPSMRPRWGRVTVSGWYSHLRRTGRRLAVFVDGTEVTERCVTADDVAGVAWLLRMTEAGLAYLGPDGEVASEIVHGDVEIAERGVA